MNLVGSITQVILQSTSFCNLNCSYCYISEQSRKQLNTFPLESIEPVFRNIFQSALLGNELRIVWHEGEPLTLPIHYYANFCKALDTLAEEVCPQGFKLTYYLQTNATLLTQEWCDFFKSLGSRFGIGISCDGPVFLHDRHRRDWSGASTHAKVLEGITLLEKNEIPFKTIAVLSKESLKHPQAFFDFFYGYRHSLNAVEFSLIDTDPAIRLSDTEERALQEQYHYFLTVLLELWRKAPEKLPLLPFTTAYYNLYHLPDVEKQRQHARHLDPFALLNIDSKGNASTFAGGLGFYFDDRFALYPDGTFLGNLHTDSLDSILQSSKCIAMAQDFKASMKACRSSCDYFSLCSGGNPIEKYEKNGTIHSTETSSCRLNTQTPINVILNDIAKHTSLQTNPLAY